MCATKPDRRGFRPFWAVLAAMGAFESQRRSGITEYFRIANRSKHIALVDLPKSMCGSKRQYGRQVHGFEAVRGCKREVVKLIQQSCIHAGGTDKRAPFGLREDGDLPDSLRAIPVNREEKGLKIAGREFFRKRSREPRHSSLSDDTGHSSGLHSVSIPDPLRGMLFTKEV
jgi:hypothetical protein